MRRPTFAPRRRRAAAGLPARRPSGPLGAVAAATGVIWVLGAALTPCAANAAPPAEQPTVLEPSSPVEEPAAAMDDAAEGAETDASPASREGAAATDATRRGDAVDPGADPNAPDETDETDAPARPEDPDADTAPATETAAEAPRPPRIDGAFVGGTLGVGMTFTRVNDLATPSPMLGPVGLVSAGDAVFPWLTIGVSFYGGGGFAGDQRVGHGGLLLDVGLLPAPKRAPFSFRLGAGFGAGAVRDADETARFGFGGALFRGGVRYEFFPTAAKRRPNRGGGWSIGPELTWLGETPAAAGRPMANTILLGLWTGFYFGS